MSPQKIMVVDDNAATRRMVRAALMRNGHTVIEAADGASARALMASEQPRIVLQDLILPDADGFELVGQLRKLAGSEVTIVAFSGLVSQLDESRISSVGFDDMITKPIAPSRLLPLIEAYVPAPITLSERFGAGRHLVIADDDPLQLKLAAFRLGRLGFEVEAVLDGKAALDAIRRRKPDAVVSDVMMPLLDGFGLAMALRQDPLLQSLPLVLVTSSYVDPSDRELARRAGANDLIVRTPELVELIELLRHTLSRKQVAPVLSSESLPELEREHSQRVLRQLERQVMLNSGLAKRCSSLASELTVLTGIAEAVLKHRDVDAALDEALGTCFDAGGIAVGAMYLLDESGALRVRSVGPDPRWAVGDLATFFGREPVLRDVIATGTPLYLASSDVPSEMSADVLLRCAATALLVVPLSSAVGPLGALLMVARDREIDVDDWRAFAFGVGTQISQVLTLARAYDAREAAERKAARQAALLEAVVDSAPDYVMQIDLEGRIGLMAWNEVRHRARVIKTFNKVPRVDANESRIGQVFLNLIVNAVQSIPEGNYEANQIRVTTSHEGDRVVVTIGDTGSGITAEVQARLFTPFFTTKPIGVGTGLGLAISHRIISALGGAITFESEVGKGTTFRVSLPMADPNLPTASQKIPVSSPAKRRGSVLVIDDEETLVNALRRYLAIDHEVTAVTNARIALQSLANGTRYDVILCDLMMPQITGMELHAEIVKLDASQAAKMVFMTGGAFTVSARQFLDATPNRRIEKPFDLKSLRHLVNALVD